MQRVLYALDLGSTPSSPTEMTPEDKRKKNAEYQRKWYLANKEKHVERAALNRIKGRDRNRAIVLEYLNGGCVD